MYSRYTWPCYNLLVNIVTKYQLSLHGWQNFTCVDSLSGKSLQLGPSQWVYCESFLWNVTLKHGFSVHFSGKVWKTSTNSFCCYTKKNESCSTSISGFATACDQFGSFFSQSAIGLLSAFPRARH
jgi:hypothetical protein